ERWGTVSPACCVMSSNRGTGAVGAVWAAQGMAREMTKMAVQSLPMGFVYSSRVFMRLRAFLLYLISCVLLSSAALLAQKTTKKPEASASFQLTDITAKSGIHFEHAVSPEKKYLIESMSGGVLLLDYDQDGWLDIYFTNAPSVDMAKRGQKVRSALYHNNHDGTFTDVTDRAGVANPCWAMGGAVADYNNDGWPDMLITCEEGMVLYRNNGNGTFSDATKEAHFTDPRSTTGDTFATYID